MATIEILHPPPPMAIPPIMGRSFIFYRDMPTRASSLRRRWVRRDRITQLRLSSGHLSMSSFAPDQLGNRMRQKAGYPAGAPLAPPGSKAYGLSFFCVDFMNIRSCGSGRTENHDPVRLSGDLWSDVGGQVSRCFALMREGFGGKPKSLRSWFLRNGAVTAAVHALPLISSDHLSFGASSLAQRQMDIPAFWAPGSFRST